MEIEFIQKNIVILGVFKPGMFDKLFFIKNNLLNEDAFLENCIFTTEFSFIDSKEFTINITQEQIVINDKNPNININIQNFASAIIQNQEVKIIAVGYNLKWFMFVQDELNKITKDMFYSPNNLIINKFFNTDDSVFGYYASKNYKYSRLKLDVKPLFVKRVDNSETRKVLNFDFNFHIDNNFKNSELAELVLDYENFIVEAKEIIKEYV